MYKHLSKMRFFYCILFLLTGIAVNAFENKNSALNFAWDYAKKNIESHGHYGYRIGILSQNVEFIVNREITVLPPEEPQVVYDTIYVPQEHYVIGIEDNIRCVGGCQPYTLLFLSKKDSSYYKVESCGDFLNDYDCDIPFQNLLTREGVVDSLLSNLKDIVNEGEYDVYIYDDKAADTLEISSFWQFLVQQSSDSNAIMIYYYKELGPENRTCYLSEEIPYTGSKVGYTLLYPQLNVAVENIDSDFMYEIYPNPASTFVNVCLQGASVCLYGMNGEKLKCEDGNVIDVSEYPSGVYLLKITKDNICRYQRLIVK